MNSIERAIRQVEEIHDAVVRLDKDHALTSKDVGNNAVAISKLETALDNLGNTLKDTREQMVRNTVFATLGSAGMSAVIVWAVMQAVEQ